jgi:hypothetical protein
LRWRTGSTHRAARTQPARFEVEQPVASIDAWRVDSSVRAACPLKAASRRTACLAKGCVVVWLYRQSQAPASARTAQAVRGCLRAAATDAANRLRCARRIGSLRPFLHASSSSSDTPNNSARSEGLGTRSQSSTNSRSASSADPAAPPVLLGSGGYSLPAGCASACVR